MMFGIMFFCEKPVNYFKLEDPDLRIGGTDTFLTGGASGMHSKFFFGSEEGGGNHILKSGVCPGAMTVGPSLVAA